MTQLDHQPPRFPQGVRRRPHASRSRSRPIRSTRRRGARPDAPLAPNVWVTIATDGTITIVSPAAEMGQGSFTTLPLILAEELDADWSKVKPVQPPAWDEKSYGNPALRRQLSRPRRARPCTAISSRCASPARRRGACCIDAVAAKWNVPAGELSTEPSVVVHKASGRRIGYGEIAAFAKAPAELPKIEDKDLKPAASFRLIGKDMPRVEVPLKVTGAAQIRHGRRRCRAWSTPRCCSRRIRAAQPETVDDAAARAGRRHHRRGAAARRRRRHRHHGRGDAGGQGPAQGHLVERARREPRQRARARGVRRDRARQEPRGRRLRQGGDAKAAMEGAAQGHSAANTARATSTTPRWSR